MQNVFKSASQSADDPLTFVLSDDSTDRMGDRIQPSGWDLAAFKTNPIALWAHASTRPIGTWDQVKVEGQKLIGKLKFAAAGTSTLIDELRSLVEQRVLRTVSVGFTPIDAEPIRDPQGRMTGWNFLKQELLEVSLVAVPANPNAIAVARSLNLSEAAWAMAFETPVKPPGASAVKAREAIAKAQAALGIRK